MASHIVPLYTLQKARKNGSWKLVQQTLLSVVQNGTTIEIQDDNKQTIATLTTARDFSNWWNDTFR